MGLCKISDLDRSSIGVNLWVLDTSPDVAGLLSVSSVGSLGLGGSISGADLVGKSIGVSIIRFVLNTLLLCGSSSVLLDLAWVISAGLIIERKVTFAVVSGFWPWDSLTTVDKGLSFIEAWAMLKVVWVVLVGDLDSVH